MNIENETPLEQWMEETKKKNLSLKDLENYIRNSLSCPYGTVFSQLPGLDSQDKAEILFNEWNTQPKPIEKWSVGSYVVFLNSEIQANGFNKGSIQQIHGYNSLSITYYSGVGNTVSDKGISEQIKWFATKSEAEEFAKTLVESKKEEVKQPLEQAVHCETQEQWDFVLEKLNYKFYPPFNIGYRDTIDFINLKESFKAYYKDYQILSFQEWCDLNGYKMEEKLIQEIGVWYKWIKHSNSRDGLKYAKAERFSGNILYYSERIDVDGTYKKQNSNCAWDAEMVKINLSEIQEFLPDGHPDKIKPNQEFKVGDWVVWRNEYIDTIKRHCNSYSDSWYLSEKYNSCSELALRHATAKEVNDHLFSTKLIIGDSVGKYIMGIDAYETCKSNLLLSIDDEELPMVSIIRTNTIKQLLNSE